MPPIALLDANVLYPSLIRNLLMHTAAGGLIAARWTAAIHDEWIRNLLADRPDITREQLDRTRTLMELAVPDAEVTGYEHHVPSIVLPDPDDRHVLAAAVHAGAEYLVTLNLVDFPGETLRALGIEAVTPDTLLCRLLDSRSVETLDVIERTRLSFRNPPFEREGFQARLREIGLPEVASKLQL